MKIILKNRIKSKIDYCTLDSEEVTTLKMELLESVQNLFWFFDNFALKVKGVADVNPIW